MIPLFLQAIGIFATFFLIGWAGLKISDFVFKTWQCITSFPYLESDVRSLQSIRGEELTQGWSPAILKTEIKQISARLDAIEEVYLQLGETSIKRNNKESNNE